MFGGWPWDVYSVYKMNKLNSVLCDVRPFYHVGNATLMLRCALSTLQELLAMRTINHTFREVIDVHIVDVWYRLVRLENITKAFKSLRPSLYFIEHTLMAYKWCLVVGKDYAKEGYGSIRQYSFHAMFGRNRQGSIDELCLRYLDVNYNYSS